VISAWLRQHCVEHNLVITPTKLNKCVGFAVVETFLGINGFEITATSDAIYDFINGQLEAGCFRYEELVAWLRNHTKPV